MKGLALLGKSAIMCKYEVHTCTSCQKAAAGPNFFDLVWKFSSALKMVLIGHQGIIDLFAGCNILEVPSDSTDVAPLLSQRALPPRTSVLLCCTHQPCFRNHVSSADCRIKGESTCWGNTE